jgi:predicted phosphodiesterase
MTSPFPVLAIGDTHCPCMHPKYPTFLTSVFNRFQCKTVVHIGDLVDLCSMSYHEKDADLDNFEGEYHKTLKQVRKLYRRFPNVHLLLGNHDSLIQRKAQTAGFSQRIIRDYRELYRVPDGWKIHPRFTRLNIGGVLFAHGDCGKGGKTAALANATAEFTSYVQGHLHQLSFVINYANQKDIVFGCQTGCGVDHKHIQQAYGVKYNQKPILSCAVIISPREAYSIPMKLT